MPQDRPETDQTPQLGGNERGTQGRYSGEEADSQDSRQPRYVEVGVSRGNREADPDVANAQPGEDISPDMGKRAFIDEKTGEVHGSGAGTGGGTGTEDYDHDTAGGGNDDPAVR